REARQRDIAASALGGVLHRARGRARRDSDLPRASDRAVLAPLGVRPRLDPAGRERVVVRARLPPARAGAGVVRDRGGDRVGPRPTGAAAALGRRAALALGGARGGGLDARDARARRSRGPTLAARGRAAARLAHLAAGAIWLGGL